MTNRRFAPAALLVALLSSCDAENVQWAFVSNPGGSFGTTGGAVIVIRITSSSALGLEGDFLRVEGFDSRGPVSVLLLYAGDFGVLVHGNSVELRSPALSFDDGSAIRPGRVDVSGGVLQVPPPGGPAALRVQLPDSSVIHPGGVGPGTLHIARAGTLLILESAAGLVVFGEQAIPEVVGTSATLITTPAGNRYALRLSATQVRLLNVPPLPLPGQRLVYVAQRDSMRILGPLGEVLAELPAASVTLQGGTGGMFLSAALPEGLPGDPTPMNLLMAADNRYLLRIDQ
ncbi:MAG TPA: hypothetical protein VFT55_06525 [Planctomycetota bacterium]|nr:hypothetical protein [Planctomycetota bacterium]